VVEPTARLVGFARALREEGLPVGPGRVVEFCRAAAALPAGDLYWAGRLTLVSRPEEIPIYDRVFRGVVEEEPPPPGPVTIVEQEVALASPQELLRTKSFAELGEDELVELASLMRRLRLQVPSRRTRRREAARRGDPDLRRTLRRSFRTGGEPVERAWRARRRRRRRLVLLLDVSGSMADYSRALVLFARAALQADARWEAFCFGTRLTRVTKALGGADAQEALRRAAEEVVDWNGGTRIGAALRALTRTNVVRGSVVVICSDGLDVGDPDLLRTEMARLSRLAHRVVWLNPLKEDPAYEPLARGMRAALPHVDDFASGHNLASLEAVAETLARAV
jgi:uncharacterized protein with von Willebrand factor type A (vWA) domain